MGRSHGILCTGLTPTNHHSDRDSSLLAQRDWRAHTHTHTHTHTHRHNATRFVMRSIL
ncbi:hypothetical protein ASPBRDRAFT_295220 [Aspergillus brasiliensis CBS 101740]|uniref:Uncharacterized protein n=1 Tax=Aspergillus brasiliensis (strain CBS 101740 / IMI 381727 / IBT 21946) TaxID=767769 RepID=A0A1L9UBS6_ASPBC|nr:hypothetical protein ASPBRDRAFT_295220 [Aspergillus brasiliensis CBS 101740]